MSGSSNGDAAIYFGFKNYVGHVKAGAPQSNFEHFLINQAKYPNIASYISGRAEKADQDELLYKVIQQPFDISPLIKIMVVSKIMYGQKSTITYYVKESDVYQVRNFVRDQFGNKVTQYTSELVINQLEDTK